MNGDQTNRLLELYRQYTTSISRFGYFMMALSASSIAFAIQKTLDRSLEPILIPLGVAVLSWGFSLFFGLKNRRADNSTLNSNIDLLTLESGEHPGTPADPQERKVIIKMVTDTMNEYAGLSATYSQLQFRLFILGVISFIGWHVLEMYYRI